MAEDNTVGKRRMGWRMIFVSVNENKYNEKHGGDIYVDTVITDLNNPGVTEAVGLA